MDRFDPFVKYADVYGDIINWEKDPMNKPQNQNKYFFSDGKTYYEQICKMLRLMSVFKEAFNQIYSNEDEISEAWENFVNNLSASVVEGSEPDVTLTWTDDSVNFEFTMVPGVPGEQGVGITSISFNSDYTMTITLSDGNSYTSMSLKGETGPQGPQGETGSGLQILDVYATLADLQSAHPTGQPGDAYQVGSAGNYTLYIWSSSQSAWIPAGSLGTVSPSTSSPLMDGTASAGSSDLYSRGDHVHPSDTSRASQEELDALIRTSQALIDQSFTYRESPAIQDGLAKFDKIKGNTLVWNQLVEKGNMTDGWTFSNSTGSYSNNVLTFTASAQGGFVRPNNPQSIVANHKYIAMVDVKGTSAFTSTINFTSRNLISINITTNWQTFSLVFTNTITEQNYFPRIYDYRQSGWDSIQIKNCMIFDLAKMGLDFITEPSEFISLFTSPYYEYNTGSLLSFNGTGLKTTGKNIWSPYSTQTQSGIVMTANNDGTYTLNGTATGNAFFTINPNLPKATYRISLFNSSVNPNVHMAVQNKNRQYVMDATMTTVERKLGPLTDDIFALIIWVNVGTTLNNYVVKPFLCMGDNIDIFEPYTSSTTNLPISTYFPTGMKSAGNAHDELTENKAITRIGGVDLGSLTWRHRSEVKTSLFSATMPDYKKQLNTPSISAKYSYAGTVYGISGDAGASGRLSDKQYALYYQEASNDKIIYLYDTSFTDVDSLVSSLSGSYIYYEMALPVETAVDIDISFTSYENGTEQLLPMNGSVPATSPIIADMTYLSIDDAMEYIINKLANVPQNTQQILEALEDDVADLQEDVGALQPAVSALQTSVGNINTNIGQLSSTVAGHTASISDMQSDISDLNTSLGDLEDTVTDNTSRIGTLETDLATTDGQVQNLATSVSGLDSTVTAQGETVTALDNFVSNIANTRNPGYMSSDNSIGITSAFLNMTLAAGQSTWANIPLPTIMAGFIPLFVVGASTGDGSVCLFKIPSTYNQNNIYKVGVKNTSNSEVTTQVGIEILCIKQRQSQ